MKIKMYDFLFLDERDSPNLTELKGKTRIEIENLQNKRHFGLIGIILSSVNYPKLNMSGRRLQEKYFGKNKYYPLHYHDMLNNSGKFAFLGTGKYRQSISMKLDYLLSVTDFKVIGSFVEKTSLALDYGIFTNKKLSFTRKIKPNISPKSEPDKINLYNIALKFLLADFFKYLKDRHRKGLIIAEARGDYEDSNLLDTFFRYQNEGTGSLTGKEIRENIIDLLVIKKSQNHIGLQIADILCYPCYDYFVPDHNARSDHLVRKERFDNKIVNINIFPTKKEH